MRVNELRRREMVDADNGEGIWPGSSSMSYPKQLSPHLELQLLRGGPAAVLRDATALLA